MIFWNKDELVDQLNAQVLVLNKLIYDMELRHEEKLKEIIERSEEIRIKFERTENMFQSKEKKWSELERIVVQYARKDHELRHKLTEIKYICDDPSSKRRITTVVEENEVLKSQIDEMEIEMEHLKKEVTYAKSHPTYMYEDDDDDFQINNMHFQEDEVRIDDKALKVKTKGVDRSQISDNKSAVSDLNNAFVDKSRIDTSNMIGDGNNSILGGLNLDPSQLSQLDKLNLDNKSQIDQMDRCQLDKSNMSTNEWSRCKKLIFENQRQAKIICKLKSIQSKEKDQNLFDSFGVLKPEHANAELKINSDEKRQFNIEKDKIISGSHIKNPNTIEIKDEISGLEASFHKGHNRTMSYIPYPKLDERMESPIRHDEVF